MPEPLSSAVSRNLFAQSSEWGSLSKHLIATFYEVDRKGKKLDEWTFVQAPLVNISLDLSMNWQSPFEGAGAESKAPMLLAMIQSGSLQPVVDAIAGKASKDGVIEGLAKKAKEGLKGVEGRTGITKLNSTQVFSGQPPAKIQLTAFFRAWSDPFKEVIQPYNTLVKWSLAEHLKKDSTIFSSLIKGDGLIDSLLPSKSPKLIALEYKGRTYSPMVIENITIPLDSPITNNGDFSSLSLPITLSTLTALDAGDWLKTQEG